MEVNIWMKELTYQTSLTFLAGVSYIRSLLNLVEESNLQENARTAAKKVMTVVHARVGQNAVFAEKWVMIAVHVLTEFRDLYVHPI